MLVIIIDIIRIKGSKNKYYRKCGKIEKIIIFLFF